ncbi:MAG TPA: amino acid hydroxylase [Chloroflexota bacterium]|nr:amino acid hydroxylase [Chloroflexota bacterium]
MFDYDQNKLDYDAEDHHTWNQLCTRQHLLVEDAAAAEFFPGMQRIGLDYTRIPDIRVMSDRLRELCGWTLVSAENEYLADAVWFDHLRNRRFPVTSYIRRPDELDFTPIPDLFHEYFGHLAFVNYAAFAAQAERFGRLYFEVPEEDRIKVANFWWFSWEFGFIDQEGQLKIFGAGLLSSPGELRYALSAALPKKRFHLNALLAMRRSPHEYHDAYAVYDSFDQIDEVLAEIRQRCVR